MKRLATSALASFALAFTLGACASSERAADSRPMAARSMEPDANATADPVSFSDGEVMHLFITGNMGEVMTNETAAPRAGNPEVRTWSQRMVAEHTAVVQRTQALGQRLGLAPAANELSTHLDATARGVVEKLRPLSGPPLDMLHIDTQVVMHQNTLDLIDNTLLPNARNAELRALIASVRPAVVQHLDHAKMLQRTMMAAR